MPAKSGKKTNQKNRVDTRSTTIGKHANPLAAPVWKGQWGASKAPQVPKKPKNKKTTKAC